MKPLKVEVGSDDGQKPLCPHCGKELTHVIDYRSHLKFLANLHAFACPHCRKVLGVSAVLK
jgi:hypothetical protein